MRNKLTAGLGFFVTFLFLSSNLLAEDRRQKLKRWVVNDRVQEVKKYISRFDQNPDLRLDPQNNTPLIVASRNGSHRVVKFLLSNGADPSVFNKNGLSALITAVSSNHIDIVKILLDNGANPNIHPPDNNSQLEISNPLTMAVELGFYEIAELLLDNGGKIDITNEIGMTPLIKMSCENNTRAIKFLLKNDAYLAHKDHFQWNAVHCAASNGALEALRLLLAKGSNPNSLAIGGYTPLSITSRSSLISGELRRQFTGVLKRRVKQEELRSNLITLNLILNGARRNIPTDNQNYPLHHYTKARKKEPIKLLLRYGSNPFLENKKGTSALDIAGRYSDPSLFRILVEESTVSSYEQVPYHIHMQLLRAVRQTNRERIEKYLSIGGNPNFESLVGWTPLLRAVANGREKITEQLLNHGGKPCRENKWNVTPYEIDRFEVIPGKESYCKFDEFLPIEFKTPGFGNLIDRVRPRDDGNHHPDNGGLSDFSLFEYLKWF